MHFTTNIILIIDTNCYIFRGRICIFFIKKTHTTDIQFIKKYLNFHFI